MTVRNSRKLLSLGAFLLALILTMSMLTLSVFADGEEEDLLMTTTSEDNSDEIDGAVSDEAEDEIPSNDIATDDAAEDETLVTAAETDTDEAADTDEDADDTSADPQDVKVLVISWIIVVAIIAVIVVICVTKRDKVIPFFKGLKSEAKKVVWTKKEDVMKSTLVTLVIIAATFIVVFVLDFSFSKGINALNSLFN